ncbi:MAG: glycerate kinase [Chloroherpetonaceae bacterium]|nr:glycerate kinase [Chthonomonadaceae bacterium]MDW8207310.1 glycerate kinase [Chloroherpetonaceae bacterium]
MRERPLRVLICPNAFKGSLTALQAAQAIDAGLRQGMTEAVDAGMLETVLLPLADGGDGTLETLVAATGGTVYTETVRDPLGRPVTARWGRLGGARGDTAVIEMAEASGLRLLRPEERDPLRACTYGTGELMRAAVRAGCRSLLVGIGGSATNDGGAGMARALGARFLDAAGTALPPGGGALARLERVDLSGWDLPGDVRVVVACDVDNPLCGPEGASAVYGPQKGATPEMVRELDAALAHYARVLEQQVGVRVADVPGAGAAGGLGAGLMAFCHAELRPGTEIALEVTGFDARLRGCDLVLTGEGRLDEQTVRGKLLSGVLQRARTVGVPVIALVGAVTETAESALHAAGLTAALSIVRGPCSVEAAMRDARPLLTACAARVGRLLQLGSTFRGGSRR